MNYGSAAEKLMGMDNRVWARHANPISVWTRIATAPFWFLGVWSYVWVGWWALLPIAILAGWTWLNPRLFPPPKSFDSWASKGVIGERVWLARQTNEIPSGFIRVANILTGLSAIYILIAAYGFVVQDFWAAFLGWHSAVLAKVWFVDRKVWLWEQTPDKEARLRDWGMTQ